MDSRDWIKTGQQEWPRQQQVKQGLKLEESEEFQREVSPPFRPQIRIAAILVGILPDPDEEMCPEPEAPEPTQKTHQQPPLRIARPQPGKEHRQTTQPIGPGHVDPTRVARP